MSYDSIKLEKGMYAVSGKSFSDVLEELDPSAAYAGTHLEGLDAFSRQLKRFDIKVAGNGSDCVQKFFNTTQSAALFPEYISRAVRQGITEANLIPEIVATTTKIDSMDYRTIYSVPTAEEKSLGRVEEGASIPQTIIRSQENLVKLNKYGRMLVASYEALKFQRLDLFTVTLKQIGAYIARQQLNSAIDVLLQGDGNGNPAETIATATGGKLVYTDLINLVNKLYPYDMTTIIASPATMVQMLNMEEFKNPQTGINFQGTGKIGHPLGANFIKTAAIPDGMVLGLDKRYSLEMVVAQDVAVDYDKLIDRQLERAAITSIAGFSKIFKDASAALSI